MVFGWINFEADGSSSIEDELGKNQLLAVIFGPRSTPRHEVDGMCMAHNQASCPAFQINLELSETNILCFPPVLVKSGQNDSKIMVWDDFFSGISLSKIFFSKTYYPYQYRDQV